MRTTILFLSGAAVLLFAMGAFAQKPVNIKAGKAFASVTVADVQPFTSVSVLDDIDVAFTQSAQPSAGVYGSANLVELVEINVVNGVLQVKFSQPVRVRGEKRLEVVLSGPALEKVTVQNGGEFEAEGVLNATDLDLHVMGEGELSLGTVQAHAVSVHATGRAEAEIGYLTADSFTARAEGQADIEASGAVSSAELTNLGAGKVDAEHLRAAAVIATVNGTGDIKCRPVKELTANANGTGKIEYKGFPVTLTRTGKARKIVRN